MPSSSTSFAAASTTLAWSSPILCDMRLFPLLFRQRLCHDVNGAIHRRLGLAKHPSMSYGQHGWLERQQFARALQGQPFMPRSKRRQGEEQFECTRYCDTALRLEGIAGDHRAVSRIKKGNMTRSMSRRGNHFERTNAITFMQKKR